MSAGRGGGVTAHGSAIKRSVSLTIRLGSADADAAMIARVANDR